MAVKYEDIYKDEYKKAIGNSVAKLEESEKAAQTSLKKNYDATAARLKETRDESLKQAYISKMKEEKDAPAILARQGLGGGYSETNQANITRNYQNNRAAANKNYQDNLTNADVAYNSDAASLKATYADAINAAKQNAISLAMQQASQRYNAALAEEQAAGSGTGGGTPATDPAAALRNDYVQTGTVVNTKQGLVNTQRQTEAPAVSYTYRYENGTLYRVGLNANGRPVSKTPVNSNKAPTGTSTFTM